MQASPRGTHSRIPWRSAVLLTVPWLWFAVRRLGGPADTVAVALPLAGMAALGLLGFLALALRRPGPLLAGVSAFVVCIVATLGPRLPHDQPFPRVGFRIAMANVFDTNPGPYEAVSALAARGTDVLAAVEMGKGFFERMSAAVPELKYGLAVGELGVRSRWPLAFLGRPDDLVAARVLRARVDAPGTPFVLYVIHARNPQHETSFTAQREFTERLLRAVAEEELPVAVIGDLNMSDRTLSYRMLRDQLRDAMRDHARPGSTYFGGTWSSLLLRIDHLFITPALCAANGTTFTVPGSDHRGIQATIGPCSEG